MPKKSQQHKGITTPILKWVGGKTQIIDSVLETFPKEFDDYYEPFLGGGSVLLAVLSLEKQGKLKINGKVIASDLNKHLINFYQNIQQNPSEVISELKKIVLDYSTCSGTTINRKPQTHEDAMSSPESYYYWIRRKFNENQDDSPRSSATFLFINKTCFRGMYREGPNGYNVPYGNYKSKFTIDEKHINEISILVKDVNFKHCSFDEALKEIKHSDFAYIDPPYAPETESSFVSYTSHGFNLEKHKHLFTLCNKMMLNHIKFTMSNADVLLVRHSFVEDNYHIKTIECRRAINAKNPESKTNELLIWPINAE
jgi:DNA adenine methylase